jgi:hypothetical protein
MRTATTAKTLRRTLRAGPYPTVSFLMRNYVSIVSCWLQNRLVIRSPPASNHHRKTSAPSLTVNPASSSSALGRSPGGQRLHGASIGADGRWEISGHGKAAADKPKPRAREILRIADLSGPGVMRHWLI